MSLEAGIWFPRGEGGTKEEKEEKEKKEKFLLCESIGHRPLRVRCPKGDKREKERKKRRIRKRKKRKEKQKQIERGLDV